jgi:hypothetical protein
VGKTDWKRRTGERNRRRPFPWARETYVYGLRMPRRPAGGPDTSSIVSSGMFQRTRKL